MREYWALVLMAFIVLLFIIYVIFNLPVYNW